MPPKKTIEKEQIIKKAFGIVRKEGMTALTARRLATDLGCSTQPVYKEYKDMKELKDDIYEMAVDFALEYMKDYKDDHNSPALNLAIGYLTLAAKEPILYNMVFISGYRKIDMINEKLIGEELMCQNFRKGNRLRNADEATLRRVYLKVTVYSMGLGAALSTGAINLDVEKATGMLLEVYENVLFAEGLSPKKDS